VQLSRADEQGDDLRRRLRHGVRQAAQLAQQMCALPSEHAVEWREAQLSRLVVTEGTLIGLAGSIIGAAVGLIVAADFAGQRPAALYVVAAAAVIAGAVVTATAALLPAQALRRMPAAHLLAEE
jgi:putative ABC transport system permease protein